MSLGAKHSTVTSALGLGVSFYANQHSLLKETSLSEMTSESCINRGQRDTSSEDAQYSVHLAVLVVPSLLESLSSQIFNLITFMPLLYTQACLFTLSFYCSFYGSDLCKTVDKLSLQRLYSNYKSYESQSAGRKLPGE